MSGPEDGALPEYTTIESPSFIVTAPLSRACMADLFCHAPAEYLPLLQEGSGDIPAMIDPNSSKPYVTTLMDVVVDGTDINDVWVNVYRKRKPIRFEAVTLFPKAPKGSYIRWDDPDLQAFHFRPGCLASDWLESSSVKITFLNGSTVKHGHLSPEKLEEAEMSDFCLRLLVQPRKNVLDLEVSIAAVPLTLERLGALPVDANLLSFPCIRVWNSIGLHSVIFHGQPRATNGDGLPAYPILTGTSPDCPEHLNCDLVREAMYTQWRGKKSLNIVSSDDWRANVFPGENAPPKIWDLSAAFSWPVLDAHAEEEEDSADDGVGSEDEDAESIVTCLSLEDARECSGKSTHESKSDLPEDSNPKKLYIDRNMVGNERTIQSSSQDLIKASKEKKPSCEYGSNCYRKNPDHLQKFSHPGDGDTGNTRNGGNPKRSNCEYGTSCYRKNEDHRKEFAHPGDQDWEGE